MDTRARRLVLTRMLRELRVSPDMGDFNTRLRLQKATYLLESLGAPLEYRHSWYVRGPYSSALADDLFSIAGNSEVQSAAALVELSPDVTAVLQRLSSVLEKVPANYSGNETRWFEALGSARYLQDKHFDEAATKQTLQDSKGLTAVQVDEALRALAQVFGK
ncbi:MAG TPA: hypothetical protein VIL17_04240 [Coriobacteriia bacterium]